jgi:hypothetical protein
MTGQMSDGRVYSIFDIPFFTKGVKLGWRTRELRRKTADGDENQEAGKAEQDAHGIAADPAA